MELKELREAYKKQFGRYPSSKMKLESIESKLMEVVLQDAVEIIPVIEEEAPGVGTMDKLFNESIKPIVPDTKVVKMTSRIYNALKAKGKI